MHELFKKLGSIALGLGALILVLANAAMTHGCARSSTTQVTPQAATPSEGAKAAASSGTVRARDGGANPNCTPPSYMYATKAPIWVPPECYGGAPAATPAPQQGQRPGVNTAQQAP